MFDDGTMALVPVAGGAADPSLPPAPAATSVTAHPGDNLNVLANQYGTVHLSAGTYTLTHPLVLSNPVTITADPGATLLFAQDQTTRPGRRPSRSTPATRRSTASRSLRRPGAVELECQLRARRHRHDG